jgi:glycosyltransferase involved in cell wall biosynthesis
MEVSKIIFILPNIYECKNGVSTKYINYLNYISNKFNIVLFIPNKNNSHENYVSNNNIKIIKTKGISIPFYKDIIIPVISEEELKTEIITENEIIIFNGEFVWLYNCFNNLKKTYPNIKIYPTMHTDYLYYGKNIYKIYNFTYLLKHLDNYLEKKLMTGIIVTGEKLKNKYLNHTDNVFNANEVNLDIFKNPKYDLYNNNFYNFIYCGRISKEKNIDEILDCVLKLYEENINFKLNIIGDGPYMENFINLIEIKYYNIKSNIIFYGSKEQSEISDIYNSLENRIFLFTSLSETFGKTPMEAGATGIPIFIKRSDITDYLYINKHNAFIFECPNTFLQNFKYFINQNLNEKKILIDNSIKNILQYDQINIFEKMTDFILEKKNNLNKEKLGILDKFTLYGIYKLINCSGNIFGE